MNAINRQRWQLVKSKNETSARFLYAVKTTGIVCRVGCASRLPLPENVVYFEDLSSALLAGYRPCKRCQPDQLTDAATSKDIEYKKAIRQACERINQEPQPPVLADLALKAGLSPAYFQRKFKAMLGISPKQYAQAVKARRFQAAIETAPSVTAAIYEAELSSSGRAYELAQKRLGMTPSSWRAGGKGELLIYTQTQTELGFLGLACSPRGICGIELADQAEALATQFRARFPQAQLEVAEEELATLLEQLIAQIDRPAAVLTLPLDIQGTAFQEQVWQALMLIPTGQTRSYAEIAHQIGKPKAVRAVAGACAANRHAIVIPCHRIVRKGGQLSGYRWGVERKHQLLIQEAQALTE